MKRQLSTASAIALVLVLMVGAGWWIANAIDPRLDAADIAGLREDTARIAGQKFLDEYVEPDGRVVRRDEGGDVVSEGQAYGMLIAVAVGDETRFRSIWKWTKTNLRRADGLLAWRWADNKVTGCQQRRGCRSRCGAVVGVGRPTLQCAGAHQGRQTAGRGDPGDRDRRRRHRGRPSERCESAGYVGGRIGAHAGRRKLG